MTCSPSREHSPKGAPHSIAPERLHFDGGVLNRMKKGWVALCLRRADAILVVLRRMLSKPQGYPYHGVKELQDDAANQLNISSEKFSL